MLAKPEFAGQYPTGEDGQRLSRLETNRLDPDSSSSSSHSGLIVEIQFSSSQFCHAFVVPIVL